MAKNVMGYGKKCNRVWQGMPQGIPKNAIGCGKECHRVWQEMPTNNNNIIIYIIIL